MNRRDLFKVGPLAAIGAFLNPSEALGVAMPETCDHADAPLEVTSPRDGAVFVVHRPPALTISRNGKDWRFCERCGQFVAAEEHTSTPTTFVKTDRSVAVRVK